MDERRAAQWVLGFLALSAALPGLWASLSPLSFFEDFPVVGSWVAVLPPYNEHLTRDAGAFYLAFAGLFGWAAVRPDPALVRPLIGAWMIFSSLHLVFHLLNLEPFAVGDAVGETVTLATVLLAPVAVLRWVR